MTNARFTAWLSQRELAAVEQAAAENHCSKNVIVRVAIRAVLCGDEIPGYLKGGLDKNETVSSSR